MANPLASDQERDRILREASVIDLVTRGRKTGLPRTVELWFTYERGAVELLAHAGRLQPGTHWYRNLTVDPQVEVHVSGHSWPGRAAILSESAVPAIVDRFRAKYGEATVRQWYDDTRRLPVRVTLDPVD